MVMQLPLPAVDCAALIDQLVVERQNGVNAAYFASVHAEWRQRITEYSTLEGHPASVPAWAAIEPYKTRFLTLYNNPKEGQVQYSILKNLRNRKLQLCPGCGEEGTPNTLDHYLPKADYPHLAILPTNLSPLCDICQSAKGTDTLDPAGQKIFLHPYFDDHGKNQVLKLTINLPFDKPHGFQLDPHPNLNVPDRAQVERHMIGLKLRKRYGGFFRAEHVRLLRLASKARGGPRDFAIHLELFRDFHADRGLNCWPHIFYDAICGNTPLVNFLRTGTLPEVI